MDPSTALILFALFHATEKVIHYSGGKVADAMSKPVWEALESKARWLAGQDETAKRWRAFSRAFEQAKEHLGEAPRPEIARRVRDLLETTEAHRPADRYLLEQQAAELEKVSLLAEQPDVEVVTDLCLAAWQRRGEPTPSRPEVAETVALFIRAFQDRLFAQEAYRQLMLDAAQWQRLRQGRADTHSRYVAQLLKHHQDLDFVGIPELKDCQALPLEKIFINLQAEVDVAGTDAVMFINEGEGKRNIRPVQLKTPAKDIPIAASTGRYPGETIKRRVSANEALAENKWLIILGDPGAGKTTLLKHVLLAFAANQGDRLGLTGERRLPIFVRLYDYVAKRARQDGDYSLLDYLYSQAHENLLVDLPPGFFENELEHGRCCVCLDGLDELGDAGLRREVSTAVAALAHRYPDNRYLVTSRLVGYQEAPLDRRDFIHHTVLSFSEDDIRLFVEKWYVAREQDPALAWQRTDHLIRTIMDEPRLKDLATNPLMLTIIALVHRIEAELPHERVKLYDKCVTALIETWEKVKLLGLADRERPYYKKRRQLLEQLAFWLHTQPLPETAGVGRAREIEEGDLKAQLVQFLLRDPNLKLDRRAAWQEVDDFVVMARARTGLLVERGDGVYSFAHLTFQEYLAAAHLKYEYAHSIDDIWNVIQPHLHDPVWREVILLLLGSLNEFRQHPTLLVKRVFESADWYEPVLHRHLYLAARALADRVEVEAGLHDAIVDILLKIVRTNDVGSFDALAALGRLPGDERAAAGLLALAQDNTAEVWVRAAAAQALGELGRADEAVLSGLLALAQNNTTKVWVRAAAAEALGKLGRTDEAVRLLLALAQDNTTEGLVRYDAVHALGELSRTDEAVLSGLLALAQDNTVEAWVRAAAARALGELGRADEAVLFGLLALAQDNTAGVEVRYAAAQALGELGRANEAVRLLLALAQDNTAGASMRHAAAQALGKLGRTDEAAGLLLVLAQDNTTEGLVRYDAVHALGKLSRTDEAVLSGLLVLAQDNTAGVEVRYAAAQALGELGRKDEAASFLLALAQDSTTEAGVRAAAAEALGELGRKDKAAGLLLVLAQDDTAEARVRSAAAQAVGELGQADEAVLFGLLALAANKAGEKRVRDAAYSSLKVLLGNVDEG